MDKSDIKKEIYRLVKDYFSDDTINKKTSIKNEKIGVAFPIFNHLEVNSAIESLLNLKISQGVKVLEFEKNFSNYINMNHGIAVNSGSSANLLAISALVKSGYVKHGSEVIVPAATFTTVISPIIQCGLKPIFVDIDSITYNISPEFIEQAISENTGLIMPVHSLGCPADMVRIMEIADKHNIPVLEDCCESHGSSIKNNKVGSFGLVSTFSFFVAHNMTTGEGGMVLTNDSKLDKLMRSMREFGRIIEFDEGKDRFYYTDDNLTDYDERYVFKYIGYNIRMTDIAASLGIEQLKKLDNFNIIRLDNANKLIKGLNKYSSLKLPFIPKNNFHSFYGFPIIIKSGASFSRKEMVNHLENNGIETRAFMGGDLSKQPAYINENFSVVGNLYNTENIEKNAFFIGCHPNISNAQINYILKTFDNFFQKTKFN